MQKIDIIKLTKEVKDTVLHRKCVIKSGKYLSSYLAKNNRSDDAIKLVERCSVHDLSKIQNLEEFMALASIVDDMNEMKNINNTLSDKKKEAIKLHWKNNSHHPEHYESPNEMTDLDLLEMACDCHARSKQYGTDLIQYIVNQQELRFHFDNEHLYKILSYCKALVKLTKNDDYSYELNNHDELIDFVNIALQILEECDYPLYSELIKNNSLYLQKK